MFSSDKGLISGKISINPFKRIAKLWHAANDPSFFQKHSYQVSLSF